MKKPLQGPSLYYASDKNIFDALNQHKVDTSTIMQLFLQRNIIVGRNTPRDNLAEYFARLTHDFYDHKAIAARLGVAPRRERITSMDVKGIEEPESVQHALKELKKELESTGDVVQISRDGDRMTLSVKYSTIDYGKNEFNQVQVRDATIEIIPSDDGCVIRNTQNEYVNNIRESLISKIENSSSEPIERVTISLQDVPSSGLRSKFFHELMTNLPGYLRGDVTAVYVYKPRPEFVSEGEEDESDDGETDPHIERIALRGNGVSRSELLNELLDVEEYYIIKSSWETVENKGLGNAFDIEVLFSDPKHCTGFSFILNGVFPIEDGKLSSRRRPPTKAEIDIVSRAIEAKARALMESLREEYAASSSGDD